MSPATLAATWRTRATEFRRYGAEPYAKLLDTVADELQSALEDEDSEVLTLAAAAEYSGYSARHLSRLAASGALPSYGQKSAPRFRRGDLPRKASVPQSTGPNTTLRGITKEQIAQSIVNPKR